LKNWDDANDAIKLGAIAVLTLDPNTGKLEADEVGQRRTKGGALWGTAVGAAVGILTGGVGLIPGLLVGAGAGAGIGALFHKDVIMTDEDRAQMADSLRAGGAVLAVMADDFEVEATKEQMMRSGGWVEAYVVPAEAAEAITAASAAQADAATAVDEAESELVDETAEAVRSVSVDMPELAPAGAAAVGTLAAAANLSPDEAARLYDAGVEKASIFLERAATPQGRRELADETGLDSETVLRVAKRLDLMRLKGVRAKYGALLLAAGVDTVPELAQRNAKDLRAAMADVNAAQNMVKEMPSEATVGDWVAMAKELPRIITY
jgi:uncharacterized membrane protein